MFLRAVVYLIGAAVLGLCIFVLPVGIRAEDADGYRPILIGMYITAIPFFIALYQVLQLLRYIDQNKAFSELSVTALGYVKYCALVISGLYTAGLPYVYMVADRDDAPGVIALGLVFAFVPFVVAVFAAVLEKLLQNGLELKTENDLTV